MLVAVTGARGFIGRRVVQSLLHLGADVCIIERSSSPQEGPADGPSPAGVLQVHRRTFDLSNQEEQVHDACGAPDVLVHLAWGMVQDVLSSDHISEELPLHESFLRRALLSGTPHVIATGTCFEYGRTEGVLFEDTPTRPITPYAEAKVRLHESIRSVAEGAASDLTWLRPFYVYGEGQPTTTLWGQLHAAIERDDGEFPMSHGQQCRDYLHVEEMGRLIAEIAIRVPAISPVLNVCSGTSSRVIDLVNEWIERSGSQIRPVAGAIPSSPFEPASSVGSRSRLDAHLRQPNYSQIPDEQRS